MSATTALYPDDGFQLVSSPRSGPVNSALFHHLKRKGLKCIQPARSDGTVIKVIEPSERLNAFLLLLQPSAEHDLFQSLPDDIKNAYPKYKLYDRHIRIDQKFGTAGSKLAREKLHYQWHYTERISVGNRASIAIHVYFHYGIITGVYIKNGDTTLKADHNLARFARENCADAIGVMMKAVEDMQQEKLLLNDALKVRLAAIDDLDLKTAKQEKVDDVRIAARKAHEALSHYQEDVIDKRYDIAKAKLLYVRTNPDTLELESDSSPSSSSDEMIHVAANKQVTLPIRKLKIATRKTETVLTAAQLQERYNALRNMPRVTALQAQTFDAELQALKIEVCATYILTQDKHVATRCDVISKLLATMPTLCDVFIDQALSLNVDAVMTLFPQVQAEIPENFYTRFLTAVAHERFNQAGQFAVAQICEFFFEKSQDYRVLMSLLHTTTLVYRDKLGAPVSFSILLQLPLNDNLLIFKTIINQCGNPNFQGFVSNARGSSFITTLCMFSLSKQTDPFIMALLDRNPIVESRGLFADGARYSHVIMSKNGVASRLFQARPHEKTAHSSSEELCSASEVSAYQDMLADTPYMGSALTAYCAAIHQNLEILARLISITSTLHVVIAFAMYRYKGIEYSLIFSPMQFGVATKKDREEMHETAKQNIMQCMLQPMEYLGCIYGGDDETIAGGLQLFCAELQKR
ncbi:MAG TPA: hypothetical protein VLG38_03935, partial [Gammaproteobacteria bacterium]|nr:hypothetical protein [Gammaproteobacteria bacterium]